MSDNNATEEEKKHDVQYEDENTTNAVSISQNYTKDNYLPSQTLMSLKCFLTQIFKLFIGYLGQSRGIKDWHRRFAMHL